MPNLGKAMKRIGQKMRRIENSEKTEKNPTSLKSEATKVYVKAFPLRTLDDVKTIKNEVESGNILILRITPLANKSVEDVKQAVDELCEFVEHVGGDIARLGEERVVVTPSSIRIWREKISLPSEEPAAAA